MPVLYRCFDAYEKGYSEAQMMEAVHVAAIRGGARFTGSNDE
jgi:hypothetical protein